MQITTDVRKHGGGWGIKELFSVFEANLPRGDEIWFYRERIKETDSGEMWKPYIFIEKLEKDT